jgi:succinyl-CoA synthetase beta subunit
MRLKEPVLSLLLNRHGIRLQSSQDELSSEANSPKVVVDLTLGLTFFGRHMMFIIAAKGNAHRIVVEHGLKSQCEEIRDCLLRAGVRHQHLERYIKLCFRLESAFIALDARTLALKGFNGVDGSEPVALEAECDIDPAALWRHSEIAVPETPAAELKPETAPTGLAPIRFLGDEGSIGVIGIGGGMATAIMDWFASEDVQVSAIVDIDDDVAAGRTHEAIAGALAAYDASSAIQANLISIVLAGKPVDDLARTIIAVVRERQNTPNQKPLTLHLQGIGGQVATQIIASAGLNNARCLREAVSMTIASLGGQ